MSRSGYGDAINNWVLIRYRGAVASAIRGARGQAFLREMLAVLDAMPVKELIERDLVKDGAVCALGAVGMARGIDMSGIDVEDAEAIAKMFGIAEAMVREIEYENDDGYIRANPLSSIEARRWHHVRAWVAENVARSRLREGRIEYEN